MENTELVEVDYCIVKADSTEALVKLVQKKLNADWSTTGGPFLLPTGEIAQAMSLYDVVE